MFSTNLKRSVATLGVVAGLLAAAGPASAQILDGPVLAKPKPASSLDIATSEVFELNTFFGGLGNDTLDTLHTPGTKAGFKAPDPLRFDGSTKPPAVLDAHMEI